MVRPMVAGDAPTKVALSVIGCPLRCVDNVVLLSMFAIEEIGDLKEKS